MRESSYILVHDNLKKKIVSGDYPKGSLLPSEPELEKIFHVSRITIRKAVEMLENDGYVKKQRGVGTLILDYEVTQNLNKITSLTETLIKKGYDVKLSEMTIEKVIANTFFSELFDIPEKSQVIKITRVINILNKPFGIIENYIPEMLVQNIEEWENKFVSLYNLLEKEYFIRIEMSQDHIFAKNASEEEAEILKVPVGFALLGNKRKCIVSGKTVIYDIINLRHDMYGFDITLYGRN